MSRNLGPLRQHYCVPLTTNIYCDTTTVIPLQRCYSLYPTYTPQRLCCSFFQNSPYSETFRAVALAKPDKPTATGNCDHGLLPRRSFSSSTSDDRAKWGDEVNSGDNNSGQRHSRRGFGNRNRQHQYQRRRSEHAERHDKHRHHSDRRSRGGSRSSSSVSGIRNGGASLSNYSDFNSGSSTNASPLTSHAPPPWMPQVQKQDKQGYWLRRMKRRIDAGDYDSALSVLGEMRETGLEPETATYNHAIAACVPDGRANAAFKLYSDLRRRGLTPDEYTAACIFNTCARGRGSGLPERALSFNQRLIDGDLPRNTTSYNALIWACLCGRAVESAMDAFVMMCDETEPPHAAVCRPDSITFSLLVRACGQAGDLYQAADALAAARECNVADERVVQDFLGVCRDIAVATHTHLRQRRQSRSSTSAAIEHDTDNTGVRAALNSMDRREVRLLQQDVAHACRSELRHAGSGSQAKLTAGAGSMLATTLAIVGRPQDIDELVLCMTGSIASDDGEGLIGLTAGSEEWTDQDAIVLPFATTKSPGETTKDVEAEKEHGMAVMIEHGAARDATATTTDVAATTAAANSFGRKASAVAQADVSLANALLAACARAFDTSRAERVLAWMANEGLEPNAGTAVALARVGNGLQRGGWALTQLTALHRVSSVATQSGINLLARDVTNRFVGRKLPAGAARRRWGALLAHLLAEEMTPTAEICKSLRICFARRDSPALAQELAQAVEGAEGKGWDNLRDILDERAHRQKS